MSISTTRFIFSAITPFALKKPFKISRKMDKSIRKEAKKKNDLFIQAHLETYMNRSGKTLIYFFIAYICAIMLVHSTIIGVISILGIMLSLLHLVVIGFWQQSLRDKYGPLEPPE